MPSAVFWKSPPWRHLIAVPQVNCSTRLVHWHQNSCRRRLSLCAEQTAGARWLIASAWSLCETRRRLVDQPVAANALVLQPLVAVVFCTLVSLCYWALRCVWAATTCRSFTLLAALSAAARYVDILLPVIHSRLLNLVIVSCIIFCCVYRSHDTSCCFAVTRLVLSCSSFVGCWCCSSH